MFFSLVISSEVLKDVVQDELATSEECKICLIRTMQFQAKNIIVGNALTLDLEFLFLKEFWYFCLKNSPVFSLELLMTLIALFLIVPASSAAFIDSCCRCQQWQQLPLAASSLVLEWVK